MIILGTAQFGLAYGINNKRGLIPQEEAFDILAAAHAHGVTTLDTAAAYGSSEEVIGRFQQSTRVSFDIISKLPSAAAAEVESWVSSTLSRTKAEAMSACLIHNFSHYAADKKIWAKLERLKQQGSIKKIGFSLYHPEELTHIFDDGLSPDLVQVPCSIFDQRFCDSLAALKERRIEVHARSAFLQGLAFADPDELTGFFAPIKNKLEALRRISAQHKIPVFALCLNYLYGLSALDGIVVGVDSLAHFHQLLTFDQYAQETQLLLGELAGLRETNEEMVLPYRWRTAHA